jgi:outer membrane lipoprotein carrier protein
MIRTTLALLALALLAAVNPLGAQENGARAQLDRFADGLQTLHARFEQQVISTDGAVQDRSEGEVWLRRPERFRWEYGGDFPELVVADGERVWIYDEMLEQVTVRDQGAASMDSPLTLLTDPDRLEEQFEVREMGQAEQMHLLELRARSQESEFERILLGLEAGLLKLMIMEDAFGLRTEIRFDEVEINPELDDELFYFEPPPGVDVIGGLAETAGLQ